MTLRTRLRPFCLAAAALALVAGCTSTGPGPAAAGTSASAISAGASHPPTTITVWTFNHLPNEVAAFKALFGRLHSTYPWLTVNFVPNKDDAAFAKAVAAGTTPDVFVSVAPDNVAKFCHNGTVADLAPYLRSAGVDVAATFPKAALIYTRYRDKQCALPLLTDAYALLYSKKAFAEAGITQPPRTLEELTADARKLTVRNADGTVKRFGFVSRSDYNTNNYLYYGVNTGSTFYADDGRSTFATDPKWARLLTWDRDLTAFYGARNVQDFVGRYQAHTDDASNPLLTGAVAMELDGEWHVGEIADAAPSFDYGVAPMPVMDPAGSGYGAGNTLGTVAFVPTGSKHPQEAFFALQQLATDTTFLNQLADTVFNIPTTFAALKAWNKSSDPHWKPFVDVFAHSGSYYKALTPAGSEDTTVWGDFLQKFEAGKVPDLQAGLAGVATSIDELNARAG